ncbi:alpha-galactosidase [Jatrophihabitans telluris]|uniref:Alpha-galactosidase n=1 Tax=Jatrophihabitans telluris TaxID=2038343 RepID=A0ABY4R490_9ACTN|nr:alpha-galactosidase [Jatrophihabitans telluris]UQX90272.1 alpha-galactosidase [Jatrophihabitans telluris]
MTIVTFVGAGSAEFTRQLLRDLLNFPELVDTDGGLELVLHDVDPERLELAEAIARITVAHHASAARVRAEADLRAALSGADFVINTVNIGGHAATVADFDIPERFGVRQTIADTLGVGGVFRGLRTFGFLHRLASAMAELCPQAYLLNYTNPMAMNIGYLSTTFPDLKVLGLCHSVYWTVVDLSELVGAPFAEVEFHSAGVNHQAWLLRWEHRGQDLYPRLDELIERDPELRRRVRVDMYRRLGFYPTETSEHSSEYVPWYLHDDREIERLRIPLRDYVGISAANVAETRQLMVQAAAGEYHEPEEEAAEYAPQVIHSLLTGAVRTIQANVANNGLIDNLPFGAPVEVPCRIDAAGAHPLAVGQLPPQCAALNRTFLSVADLTVRAMIERDRAHLRHALMIDPNTAASIRLESIDDLVGQLLSAHSSFLPVELGGSGTF